LQARSEVSHENGRDDGEKEDWGKNQMDPARGASVVEEVADANDYQQREGESHVEEGGRSQIVWGKGEQWNGGEEDEQITEVVGVEARADAGGEPQQRQQEDVEMPAAL